MRSWRGGGRALSDSSTPSGTGDRSGAKAAVDSHPAADEHGQQYDAVIVGSGFGGAVAAARLAQAGLRVLVLERGRRWEPGEFPRSSDLRDRWLFENDRGLYDVRWLDEMASIQAAGWGGGSLVYANVFARPSDDVLGPQWPSELSRRALEPYFDLAAHMLQVSPVTPDPRTGRMPERTTALEEMARRMGRRAGTFRPELAVAFGDPERPVPNIHGIAQRGCSFVGECVVGCNHGAKRSLDLTYLAVAEQSGALARTRCTVTRIEREGATWTTTFTSDAGVEHVTAPLLILAAGALGTTDILLHARDVDRTLPELPAAVGTRYSGNGDSLQIVRRPRRRHSDFLSGPTITTTTIVDVDEARAPVWFQVQDGGISAPLLRLLAAQIPGARLTAGRTSPRRGRMAMLLMGSDSGTGTLYLDHQGELAVSWSNRLNALLYRAQRRVAPTTARHLGARVRLSPLWSLLRTGVTVHSLGGAPTGDSADSSVVDVDGQVHDHPGLFVLDGSSLPGPVGTNPSATILATAEKRVETLIRRHTGRPRWEAPERAQAIHRTPPEDAAMALMRQRHRSTIGNGIRFREAMRSRSAGRTLVELHLDATAESLHALAHDRRHRLNVHGVLRIGRPASRHRVHGTIDLFPATGDDSREIMRYDLTTTEGEQPSLHLSGHKNLEGRTPAKIWTSLTTLHATLEESRRDRPSTTEQGEPVTLTITAPQTLSLLLSLRGIGFTRARRLRAVATFARFFGASLLDAWIPRLGSRTPRRTEHEEAPDHTDSS